MTLDFIMKCFSFGLAMHVAIVSHVCASSRFKMKCYREVGGCMSPHSLSRDTSLFGFLRVLVLLSPDLALSSHCLNVSTFARKSRT